MLFKSKICYNLEIFKKKKSCENDYDGSSACPIK